MEIPRIKAREAKLMTEAFLHTKFRIRMMLEVMARRDPGRKDLYKQLANEIDSWTHHGREVLLNQPPGWLMHPVPNVPYIYQFKLALK